MPDTIPPALDHADLLVNGVSLYVYFAETESLPMTHGSEDPFFEVKVDGEVRGYIAPVGWAYIVTLKAAVLLLASPVYVGQTVTISLLGTVSDAIGNAAVHFTDQPVNNLSEVLPVPTGLTATGGDAEVALEWDAIDPSEDGVRIERSIDGTTFVAIHDKSTDGTTYTDTTAVNGQAYWYRIKTYTLSPVNESLPSTVAGPVMPQAPIPQLITSARAQQNASLAALATSNPTQLTALIAAASDAIRQACCRDFNQQDYVEYHSGAGYPNQLLQLRHFPVAEITRVATAPAGVLKITNGSTTNQRATVATTATGLVLVRVASAVKTTSTLLFVDFPTLTDMSNAIIALGNGWSAAVQDNHGLWPSADLKPLQGAVTALAPLGGAVLELYVEEIGPLNCWDGEGWGMGDMPAQAGWRLDEETSQLFGFFPRGILNLRIDYTGGYASIPEPIQQACVFLAADMLAADQRDGALKSARLGPFQWEVAEGMRQLVKSPKVMSLIAPYIDYSQRQGRHP